MPALSQVLSSGLPSLDRILRGYLPGDNIVWQVSDISTYRKYALEYALFAERKSITLTYFRFASHDPILSETDAPNIHIYSPDPSLGFESFITEIHARIKQNGRGGYYIFDSLSDLTTHWYSDRMLGNFFMLTCPYLLDMEALAYFAIIKGEHSRNALYPIHTTAQVVIDTYCHNGEQYVHPLKVQQRYSPTMFMLHRLVSETFEPVTNSAINSEILSFAQLRSGDDAFEEMDLWNRIFVEAKENKKDHRDLLLKMMVSRDEKILSLAKRYLSLKDLLDIGKRMIGTGLIGGKSAGMLLARSIIAKDTGETATRIEHHDSFYVGSDVFYTYMVKNGCWWIRHQQKDIDTFLSVAEYARRVILTGSFPHDIERKLSDMLDYFGQSPIIVRSSSLLEDNYGNAFSGKYESVFCPNQGSRETRLEHLLTAIKTIYASTLSENALHYRARLGILDKDEQMPLLIQRVSGDLHGKFFYPAAAGVGYSYNPFVWDPSINPESGLLRIVYGMGTRAVDRSDADYTRIVSLGNPLKRPESGIHEIRRYSQHRVDLLDLEANQLVSINFDDVLPTASIDEKKLLVGTENESHYISFDTLFLHSSFIEDMSAVLQTLEKAYAHPVDIEFTLNCTGEGLYKINIVQCRPFEVQREISQEKIFADAGEESPLSTVVESTCGTVIGRSRICEPDRIIYVQSKAYDELTVSQKHQTARTIGSILKKTPSDFSVMLIGPGRWGTTTPFLGVPVSFAEISRANIICEVVQMGDNFIPDVSLGTHFFNDLVEFDILYLALYPSKDDTVLRGESLLALPNKLLEIQTDVESIKLSSVIHVIDIPERNAVLSADTLNQHWRLSLLL